MRESSWRKRGGDDGARRKRVALVTGASSGIGYAIAVRLLREGYRVALVARPSVRLTEAVTAAATEARAETRASALAVGCDLGRTRSSGPCTR